MIHSHRWKPTGRKVTGYYQKNNTPQTNFVVVDGTLEECDCRLRRIVPAKAGLLPVEVEYDEANPVEIA